MRKVKSCFFRRTNIAAELFRYFRPGMDRNLNRQIIFKKISTSSLIKISFLAAGKQCGGMRWRESDGEEKKEERGGGGGGVTREETKERRRTPRIGDIPR